MTTEVDTDEPESTPEPPERLPYIYVAKWKIALAALVVVAVAVGAVVLGTSLSQRSSKEFRYVVPKGTAYRIIKGEKVNLFPSKLTVHVGDKLVVQNKDVLDQHVGPFYIKPTSTLRMTFSAPGTVQGTCTLNPQGQVTITILSS